MKLLIASLMMLGLTSQEKIEIKFNPKPGDKIASERKMICEFKASCEEKKVEVKLTARGKWTREIQEVSDGGISKCVVDVQEDTLERPDPITQEMGLRISPLHKKKATVSYVDGKKIVEGENLDDEIRKLMPIDYAWKDAFPPRPVAVGESWDLDVLDELKDNEDMEFDVCKFTLTLKETKEIDGVKCAVVRVAEKFRCKITHHTDDPIQVDFAMGGDMIVRLDRGYVVSLKVKGRTKISGDDLENAKIKLSGSMSDDFSARITEGK